MRGTPPKDMTGRRFGSLVVESLSPLRDASNKRRWICVCDCGKRTIERQGDLVTGGVKSCGCSKRAAARKRWYKHGGKGTVEERAWATMKGKCYNQSHIGYGSAGALGIVVCDRWKDSFAAFRDDIGLRPSPAHTLARYDITKNFEPENCYWRLGRPGPNKKKPGMMVTFDGRTMDIHWWSKETGISKELIYWRLKSGWPVEKALTVKPRPQAAMKGRRP